MDKLKYLINMSFNRRNFIPVPYGNEGENLKVLQISCDKNRKLIDVLITIDVADVQFWLLGTTVIPVNNNVVTNIPEYIRTNEFK